MVFIGGKVLTENGFMKGFIKQDSGGIEYFDKLEEENELIKGIVVPKVINSHTHIGDSFIYYESLKLPKNVEELVKPPNGLKHKLLKNAKKNKIEEGIKKSINLMVKNFTSHFFDFREGGFKGIGQIKNVIRNKNIDSLILARPKDLKYDKKELDLILKNSDGIGLSAISDWDFSEIKKIALHTKKNNKIFALHASEVEREDVNLILELEPDFLVHMICATKSDLIKIKEKNIPIVICPRSNYYFNLKTNYKLMKEVGINLLLGTDNAMIVEPNIIEEMIFLREKTSIFSDLELLNMITFSPRKALNLKDGIHGLDWMRDFVVLDEESLRPAYVPKEV